MKKFMMIVSISALLLSGCSVQDPLDSIKKGNELIESGNKKAALIEFKSALQKDPLLKEARFGLAKIYVDNREFDAAIGELNKVLANEVVDSLFSQKISPLLARAQFLSESGSGTINVPIYNSEETAYYHLSELAMRGDLTGAIELKDKYANGGDIYSEMMNIIITAMKEKPDLAVLMIDDLTEELVDISDYDAIPFYLLKINLMLATRQADKAVDALFKYLEYQSNDDSKSLMLSSLLVQEERMQEASGIVEKLAIKYPLHVLINELRGVIALDAENYELARSASILATIGNSNAVRPRIIHAYASANLGKRQEAIEQLSFIIDELPTTHQAKRLYIQLKKDNGDIDDIIDEVFALGDITSADVALISSVGLDLVGKGRINEALLLVEKAKAVNATGEHASTLGLLKLSLEQDDAFETLESAFYNDKASMFAGNSLAAAYLSTNQYDKAIKLAEEWLSLQKVVEGNMLIGLINARQSKFEIALPFFEKANNASNDINLNARVVIIDALLRINKYNDALSKLDEWAVGVSGVGLMQGFVSSMKGIESDAGTKKAADVIDNIVKQRFSDNVEARMMVANAYALSKEYALAGVKYDALRNDLKTKPMYWLLVANNNLEQGKKEAALGNYMAWMRLEPKNPSPLMGALKLHSERKEYKIALQLLEDNLANYEDREPGELLRLQFLISDGQFSLAKKAHAQLSNELKQSVSVKGIEGILDYMNKKFNSAVEKIEPMYAQAPSSENLRWLIGAYKQTNQLDKAEKTLVSYVEKNPKSTLGGFMLGNLHAGQSNYQKAKNVYLKALENDNENPYLLNNAAYSMYKMGEFDSAELLAKKAIALSPENASFADTLANILIDNGDKASASTLLKPFLLNENKMSASFMETYKKASN